MTAVATAGLRTVAFGDPGGTVWGSAWISRTQSLELMALGAGERAQFVQADLEGEGEEPWRLTAGYAELSFSPAGEAARSAPGIDAALAGFAQLCRVEGQLRLDGEEHEVKCLGVRAARPEGGDLARFQSAREVTAWFEPGEALTLLALRPRKSSGHDADLIAASVLDADGAATVAEPRLSTTYTSSGRAARVGLELWPEEEGEESERAFPRRAVGQAVGACAQSEADELLLRAELLHWRSRGREGPGVYVFVERR